MSAEIISLCERRGRPVNLFELADDKIKEAIRLTDEQARAYYEEDEAYQHISLQQPNFDTLTLSKAKSPTHPDKDITVTRYALHSYTRQVLDLEPSVYRPPVLVSVPEGADGTEVNQLRSTVATHCGQIMGRIFTLSPDGQVTRVDEPDADVRSGPELELVLPYESTDSTNPNFAQLFRSPILLAPDYTVLL